MISSQGDRQRPAQWRELKTIYWTVGPGCGITADYGTFTIGGQAVIGATTGVIVNLNLVGRAQTPEGPASTRS